MAEKDQMGDIERSNAIKEVLDIQLIRFLNPFGYFEMILKTQCGRKSVNIIVGDRGQIVDIELTK